MANTNSPPKYSTGKSTHTASENTMSWMDALCITEIKISDTSQIVNMEQFKDVQFLGERHKENAEQTDSTTSDTDRNPNDKTEGGSVIEDSKSLMEEVFQRDSEGFSTNQRQRYCRENSEVIDLTASNSDQNPNHIIEDKSTNEESKSLMDELFQTDSESFNANQGQFPCSPVKVDKIVLSTIKKLDNRYGSTLCEIKKYIYSNCDVDVDSIDQDIRMYLRNAVSNGVLIKADKWRYSVPLPKTRRKGTKAMTHKKKLLYGEPKMYLPTTRRKAAKARTYKKKPTYGKPKKPKRGKRANLRVRSTQVN